MPRVCLAARLLALALAPAAFRFKPATFAQPAGSFEQLVELGP